MTKFVVLYTFHKINALSIGRLLQLRDDNPDVTIFPIFAIQQRFPIPSHSRVKLLEEFANRMNALALRSPHYLRMARSVNRSVESQIRRSELRSLRRMMDHEKLPLHVDFTPRGDWNQDLAILNWFVTRGGFVDFEYLVFFEYDIKTTRKISYLYDPYTRYDAAFSNFRQAKPRWTWYRYDLGGRESILRWLKTKGLKTDLYACLFAGAIFSRRVLETLAGVNMPFCYCEMRMPTILTSMGFNCGALDFQMVRHSPTLTEQDVIDNIQAGIFHPVR